MKTNTQNIRISTLFAFANTCKSNSRISLCKYIGRHFCEFLRFRAGKGGDSGDYKKLSSKFFRNNMCEGNFFREKWYLQFNCLEAYA